MFLKSYKYAILTALFAVVKFNTSTDCVYIYLKKWHMY